MHDGQMMFDVNTSPLSGIGASWDLDKAITRLTRNDEIKPAIVVSVWMSMWAKGARGAEYRPQKPVTDDVWKILREQRNNFSVEDGGEVRIINDDESTMLIRLVAGGSAEQTAAVQVRIGRPPQGPPAPQQGNNRWFSCPWQPLVLEMPPQGPKCRPKAQKARVGRSLHL